MTTPPPTDAVPLELSKDDLLKYVELDLWNRFQERLWKAVGIVLTVITVVGLLGIPYYIKSEVSATLQKQAVDFKRRTDEILTYAKLLAIQSAQYDSQRYRFDADVYRLIDAIKRDRGSETREEQEKRRFNDPVNELAKLISRQDFSQVTQGSIVSSTLFATPAELKGKHLMPPTAYIVENKGLSGSGGYVENHPVKNGTYEGSLTDLRFRIVVLEGLRRAVAFSQGKPMELGGVTDVDRRVETVRVKTLESAEFNIAFAKELGTQANQFLTEDEKLEFARVQQFYIPDDVPEYKAPDPPLPGTRNKAARP